MFMSLEYKFYLATVDSPDAVRQNVTATAVSRGAAAQPGAFAPEGTGPEV